MILELALNHIELSLVCRNDLEIQSLEILGVVPQILLP